MKPTLTIEQEQALKMLPIKGWTPNLDTLSHLIGEKAVSVYATAGTQNIWFVIEPDGYTHS
jgi:hypothetical protein